MAKDRPDDRVAQFFAKAAEVVAEVGQGALMDVRQKLVEEPWFGRTAAPRPEVGMAAQLGWEQPAAQTPEKAWDALRDRLARERGHRHESAQEHDRDRDFEP